MKQVLLIVLFFLILTETKCEKIYKAVFDYGYFPYEFAKSDTSTGFLVDILNEISKEVGFKVDAKSMPWGEALNQFNQKNFDIICFYYSEERANQYNLSNSVINVTETVFYSKDAQPIHTAKDLAGKKVLVEISPLIQELFRKIAPSAEIITVDHPMQAIDLILKEGYEYAVLPKYMAYYANMKNHTDKLVSTDIIVFSNKYTFATHKENTELIQKINEGLDLLHRNGKYLQIYKKWFGDLDELYVKDSFIQKYWFPFTILVLILIALFLLWNYTLKYQIRQKSKELEREYNEKLKLQQQHQMAQFVIDHSIDSIFGIDKNSNFIYVNDAACIALGYTRQELLKMGIKDIDSSFKIDKWSYYWQLIKEGKFNHYRTIQRKKDGSLIIVEGNIFHFEFDKEEYVFAIMRDITESEKLLEQIQRSEELFRSIFESTQLPMYILDPETLRILDVNQAAETFYGYSKNEFIKLKITDINKLTESNVRQLIETLNKNKTYSYDLAHYKKNGEKREVNASASKIYLKDKNVIFSVVIDNTERNATLRKLRESEERFHKIFKLSPDGITITRVNDGLIIDINDNALKMFRVDDISEVLYNPDYTTAKIWKNIEDRKRMVEQLKEKGEAFLNEVELQRKDGSALFATVSARLVEIKGEQCILAITRDITEKIKEEKYREALFKISDAAISTPDFLSLCKQIHSIISDLMPSQNLYIALYDKKSDIFEYPYFVDEYDPPPPPRKRGKGLTELVVDTGEAWLVDPDEFYALIEQGKVESIGAPSIDWLGVPLKVNNETIGAIVVQTYTEGVRYTNEHKNILSFVSNQIAMAIAQKRYQEELIKANELLEERVEQRTLQLRHANEELLAQVEERIRIENEIRESEQRFRLMADSAPVLIWMTDYSGRISYVNKTWIDFTGKEIVTGFSDYWNEFIHEEDLSEFITKYNEAVQNKQKFEITVRLVSHEGNYRYVLLTAIPRMVNNEVFHGFIGSGVDITELQRAIEQEKELNMLKTRFISTVSHEYRTPLTTIMTATYLVDTFIKAGNLNEASKFLTRIQDSVKSMTGLLDQVLTISKGEIEQSEIKPILTNIYDFCRSFVDEYRLIDKSNHNIIFVTEDDVKQQSYIDPAILQQILSNLINNAIKYSPINSEIVLSHKKDNGNLIFVIKDQGIGIPKDQIRYIFEPFYRATNVGVVQGTGLGLSIVKKFIDLYQGKIKVESNINEGTIVTVVLPEIKPNEN